MKYLIVYGTVDGHTRKIANRISERLTAGRDDVCVENSSTISSNISVPDYDACIIAASVHDQRYPETITNFIRAKIVDLNTCPTAFISVGLAVSLEDGHAEAQRYLDNLLNDTGWKPTMTHNAAGAVRYRKYDFFQQQIVRYIVSKDLQTSTLTGDLEFTDWQALGDFVDNFCATV